MSKRKAYMATASKPAAKPAAPKKVAKKVEAKVEDITLEDILEDAKDGVLKDKTIEAVKKLTDK